MEIRKLLDFYSGTEIEKYVHDFFSAEAFREVPCYNANITRRFINKLSRIYTVGAKRNVSKEYDLLTIPATECISKCRSFSTTIWWRNNKHSTRTRILG